MDWNTETYFPLDDEVNTEVSTAAIYRMVKKKNTSFGNTFAKPQNTTGDHNLTYTTAYRAFPSNNYFMSSTRAKYWQNAISWWGWWRVVGDKGTQPFGWKSDFEEGVLDQLESFDETNWLNNFHPDLMVISWMLMMMSWWGNSPRLMYRAVRSLLLLIPYTSGTPRWK